MVSKRDVGESNFSNALTNFQMIQRVASVTFPNLNAMEEDGSVIAFDYKVYEYCGECKQIADSEEYEETWEWDNDKMWLLLSRRNLEEEDDENGN